MTYDEEICSKAGAQRVCDISAPVCGNYPVWYSGTEFLTVDNLIRVIQNNAEIAMVSIGMTIVMLLGGIDLSVGSVMGVIAIVIGYMLQAEMNIFLIVAAAIGIGVAVGFLNGFLVAKFNIPDMIVTIATMNIWKAVIFALLGGKWLTGLNPGYGVITRAKIFGIPVLLLFIIAIYALFYYFLMYRKFGRYIYATGCNPQSANLSGINVKRSSLFPIVYPEELRHLQPCSISREWEAWK